MKTRNRAQRFVAVITLLTAVVTSSCASMTSTQQRALSGTMIGAGGGAAIGAIAGNAGMGAAIGAGAGLLGGLVVDRNAKMRDQAYQQGRYDAQHGQ